MRRRAATLDDVVRTAAEAIRSERYDEVGASLGTLHGCPISVTAERDPGSDPHAVRWTLSGAGCGFVFEAGIATHPGREVLVQRWVETLPLLLHVGRQNPGLRGTAILNLGDRGSFPGLAYCDFRPELTLIPDSRFLATHGYASQKIVFSRPKLDWASRDARAVWRGQTSGWHDVSGQDIASWRDLPRVRLCEIAQGPTGSLLDAALTGTAQVEDPCAVEEIAARGLMGPSMPWQDYQGYRYQIDIDGNTSAWDGLFTKLCSGSCVLKVQSPIGYRQWYYDRLSPWVNYVPVAADMSDLIDTLAWLRAHDDAARDIGRKAQALAAAMSYEAEIVRAEPIIKAVLQGH